MPDFKWLNFSTYTTFYETIQAGNGREKDQAKDKKRNKMQITNTKLAFCILFTHW